MLKISLLFVCCIWGSFAVGCSKKDQVAPAAPSRDTPEGSNGSGNDQSRTAVQPGRTLNFDGETFLLSDFETKGLSHALGGIWETSHDSYNLGTTMNPTPLVVTAQGAQDSVAALRIYGHFGKNVEPWPYADVRAAFAPTDLSSVSKVRFWARGNGKEYVLAIVRTAVSDYSHYRSAFVAPPEWTLIELSLDLFHQPDWGKPVAMGWRDVTALSFQPSAKLSDEGFDLSVDAVELVRASSE